MEKEELKLALDQLFGLPEAGVALPPSISEVRVHIAVMMAGREEPAALSIGEVAAYASGSMGNNELAAFEAKMLASDAFFHEVMGALAFLDLLAGGGEAARMDLAEASLTSRGAQSAANLAEGSERPESAALPAFFEGKRALTAEEQRLLFREPAFRAEFDRLRTRFSARVASGDILGVPALAAAAGDAEPDAHRLLVDRIVRGGHAPHGRVQVWEGEDGTVEFLVTFNDVSDAPTRLLVMEERSDGEVAVAWVEKLAAPREDGTVFEIEDKAAFRLFIQLLQNRGSEGTFLS